MIDQISNLKVMKVHNRCGTVISLIAATVVVTGLFLVGCVSQGATTRAEVTKGAVEMVYQVTEQEALDLAQWAVEQVLPEQKVFRLKKPRLGFWVHESKQKGYEKYARFRESIFIYEIDLLRMEGSTPQGRSVVGYSYTVKGGGDLKSGVDKLDRLEQRMKEAFEQTGRAAAVSSSRPQMQPPPAPPVISPSVTALPETRVPPNPEPSTVDKASGGIPSEKPAVKEAPDTVVPMATITEQPAKDEDVFMKLKKLKELRDQKIITEEEFQSKKKELLDRI
jgi:hypothetical protein